MWLRKIYIGDICFKFTLYYFFFWFGEGGHWMLSVWIEISLASLISSSLSFEKYGGWDGKWKISNYYPVILFPQKQSYGIRVDIDVHGMDYNLIRKHWTQYFKTSQKRSYGMRVEIVVLSLPDVNISSSIPMNMSSSLRYVDLEYTNIQIRYFNFTDHIYIFHNFNFSDHMYIFHNL